MSVSANPRNTRGGKTAQIADLKTKFDKMTSAVLVNYQGMNVDTVTKLRNEFRKAGVEYRVVKNTLVKQALKGTKLGDALDKSLTGMIGLAWSYEDPSAAAKVLKAFKKDYEKLSVRGGAIEGQILDAKAVEEQLATMPGKNELRAMLLATLQAPMQQFVALINAPAQNFAYLLDAKHRELGGDKSE
jgi:large subunit ribosomal protein L10